VDSMTLMMKELSEAEGVPGYEKEVRAHMRKLIEPLTEEVLTDRLGSIVGRKTGDANGPRILLAGHLDEVGFMVTAVTPKGFIRFQALGGWWPHNMLSHRVKIKSRKGDHIGIIGSKPPHALTADERNKVMQLKDLYIDVGAKSAEDAAEMGIRPGDMIVPVAEFMTMREGDLWVGKALDNRAGCALAVEVLKRLENEAHPNVVFSGATVQEEVGLRGAGTLANLVKPDIAFALDVGLAYDTPGSESNPITCNVGDGPIISLMDATMIAHKGLRELVMDTATELGIKYQVDALTGGGTDGGRFHTSGIGVPTLYVGFATRYIHSHNAIMSKTDFDHAATILTAVIKKLDSAKLAELLE